MSDLWKLAGVQFDCKLGENTSNLAYMETKLNEAAQEGARLVVFPECALCGYCYESKAEALPFAEKIPGPSTEVMHAHCKKLGVWAIYGLLEKAGDDIFNSAVLIGPSGVVGSYRKTHLPFLGIDRFATPGDRPFQVLEIDGLRLGMLICFDGSFPEPARVLALMGADLIVLPTNWPTGGRCSADHIPPIRAHENHIYFLAVNRVGEERGFTFIGKSRVVEWHGENLAAAMVPVEAVIYATIDPAKARQKRVVNVPGKYELDRFATRRPELYGALVQRNLP